MPKKRNRIVGLAVRFREALFILLITLFVFISIGAGYQGKYDGRTMKLGVSFSIKYAEELGIDWQKAYLAALDELEIKHFRLMSYWDQLELEDDEFYWDDLDWQLDQAQRHGATVTLALGLKQPRWPECHTPRWAEGLDTQELRSEIKEYIAQVVMRYKDNQAIESYQIDNEASNDVFGECPNYDADFLQEEIDLVRRLDDTKLIISNVSNQSGLPMNGPVESVDKVGLSVYKRAHFEALGRTWFWSFWYVPSEWHSMRAALIEGLDNKPVFIHELQTEPWGADITRNLSLDEQNQTMDSEKLLDIVNFAEQIGTDEVYLWGVEWWYWRKTQFNDRELWQTVKDLYAENAADNSV